jgi:GT2 family glycosyltransferase
MRASVIVVNYNGWDDLKRCIPSVLASLTPHDELIVVDNASTDGSAEQVCREFPTVGLIVNANNGGYGEGNNLGAQNAQGDVLVFLNPDTLVDQDWLEWLIAPLNDEIGLTTAKIVLLDAPQKLNTCGNDLHFTGLTLCRGMGRAVSEFEQPAIVSAVSGAAFAIRKDLFVALGGFHAEMFLYMEDTDLSLRAQQIGKKCLYVPQSVVYHDYQLRFNAHKTYYQERNRYIMLLKTLRWRTLAVLLPALLLAETITWSFVMVRERRNIGNKLRAYRWIVDHWHELMRLRRETQRQRVLPDRDLLMRCVRRIDFGQVGGGFVVRAADALFNPLFGIWHSISLVLVRW